MYDIQGYQNHVTRRERPKSALYLELKKSKIFKTCRGRIYEKLRKQFRDTQGPFMLDKTRKPLFPQVGKIFFLKCRRLPPAMEQSSRHQQTDKTSHQERFLHFFVKTEN